MEAEILTLLINDAETCQAAGRLREAACHGKPADHALREHVAETAAWVRALGDRRNDVIHGRRRVGRDGRDAIIGRASAKDAELTIDKVGFDELIELRRDLDDARRAVDVLIRDIVRGASGG